MKYAYVSKVVQMLPDPNFKSDVPGVTAPLVPMVTHLARPAYRKRGIDRHGAIIRALPRAYVPLPPPRKLEAYRAQLVKSAAAVRAALKEQAHARG